MKNQTTNYARMGMAATMPGLVHAVEILQSQIDQLRLFMNGEAPVTKLGRPPKDSGGVDPVKRGSAQSDYWGRMTPEERKAEMKRRLKKRKAGIEPEKIGGKMTSRGVAREIGITVSALRNRAQYLGIGENVDVSALGLSGANTRLVFTAAEIKQLRNGTKEARA